MSHRSLASDVVVVEDDTEEIFYNAMMEEGVEPDSVESQQYETMDQTNLLFKAGKYINGEMKQAQTAVSLSPQAMVNDPERIHQEIALGAREVAKHFHDLRIDDIAVCGTRLRFCSDDGGWVKCGRCDERVDLADLTFRAPTFSAEAEFTNPSPSPYDIQNFLQRLDSAEQEVLKLYLLGALRRRCRCEFGVSHRGSTQRQY